MAWTCSAQSTYSNRSSLNLANQALLKKQSEQTRQHLQSLRIQPPPKPLAFPQSSINCAPGFAGAKSIGKFVSSFQKSRQD